MSGRQQRIAEMRPDEASAASDYNTHCRLHVSTGRRPQVGRLQVS
jgi:hypothetical protein